MKMRCIIITIAVVLASGCLLRAEEPGGVFEMPDGSIDLNTVFADQNKAWVGKRVRDVFKGKSIKMTIVLDTQTYSAPPGFLTKLVMRLSESKEKFIEKPPEDDGSHPGTFLVHFKDGEYWKLQFFNRHICITTTNGTAYVKEEFEQTPAGDVLKAAPEE